MPPALMREAVAHHRRPRDARGLRRRHARHRPRHRRDRRRLHLDRRADPFRALPRRLPGGSVTTATTTVMQDEVKALARERDAVILAHNYQVPEVQDVADYRRRFARALARGRRHRRRGDRLLRRPLHGRDRDDPLAGQDRADPRPRRRLLARRLDHRRPAARVEGGATRAPSSSPT